MERRAVRIIVGGAEVDVPFGAFTAGDTLVFDGSAFVGSSSLSPATILGSLYHSDWDAADSGVVLAAGKVASVPNRGLDTAAQVQATAGFQPTFSSTGFNAGAGMAFDGSDDRMTATFTTPIAIGRRPYVWVVCGNITNNQVTFSLESASEVLILYGSNGGAYNAPGVGGFGGAFVAGTARHLLELGFVASAALVADGAGAVGSVAACTTALTKLHLAAYQGSSQFGALTIRRVIIASDAPTTTQLAQMRAYFRAQPYGLTIA